MKVAISTSSFASTDSTPLEVLEDRGVEVIQNPYGRKMTESEIVNHLHDVDGLLAGLEPLNSNVFKRCPQLKAIARVGIGMDNVDLEAAKKSGIKISNTPDGPTNAVAEMTVGAALALARNIIPANQALHGKKWAKSIGLGLKNTTILIIGYGRIGRRAAELFKNFGSEIMICDPLVKESEINKSYRITGMQEGLQAAQIISLHAAGDNPILTSNEFDLMKDGVVILNSARGNLIEEQALIDALDSGKVASGWLDTFPSEPYSGRLTEYPQLILTPHMSTYSVQCRKDMEMAAVDNLLQDLTF
jgi:D-3-phosphoglycerate dehydrogenase / 2-oxoglutarate reductase